MLFDVNFLKSVGRNSKNYFNGIITEIVKKFGVHNCIFQNTAGDQYQVHPVQIGLRIFTVSCVEVQYFIFQYCDIFF